MNKKTKMLWLICLGTILILGLLVKYLPDNSVAGMVKNFLRQETTPYILLSGYLVLCLVIIVIAALVFYYIGKMF